MAHGTSPNGKTVGLQEERHAHVGSDLYLYVQAHSFFSLVRLVRAFDISPIDSLFRGVNVDCRGRKAAAKWLIEPGKYKTYFTSREAAVSLSDNLGYQTREENIAASRRRACLLSARPKNNETSLNGSSRIHCRGTTNVLKNVSWPVFLSTKVTFVFM